MNLQNQQTAAQRLHEALVAVCPINGISIPTLGTSAGVRVDFAVSATTAQKTAAQTTLTAFDWSDAGYAAWFNNKNPERTTLHAAATQAIADIATYLAIVNPTPTQVAAMVNKLCVNQRAVIQRLIQVD